MVALRQVFSNRMTINRPRTWPRKGYSWCTNSKPRPQSRNLYSSTRQEWLT